MKQLYYLFVLAIALLVSSCNIDLSSRTEEGGNCVLEFYPRECTQIISLPLQKYPYIYEVTGETHYLVDSLESDSVDSDMFSLWVMTGADDLLKMRKEWPAINNRHYEDIYDWGYNQTVAHIPSLEKQLDSDFQKRYSKTRSNGMEATNVMPWEYRVTGVTDFNIVALSSLFGQPAETSLNPFFSILKFEPKQIISYKSKNLLWGYSDNSKIEDIDEWLSMKPMAPPVIMFQLKAVPNELPADVKFVSIMETTDGKVLRDTVQVRLR